MTIDCVYFNDYIRCYRNGVVERINRKQIKKGWYEVKNTANVGSKGYNCVKINDVDVKRHRLIAYCFLGLKNLVGDYRGVDVIDHINRNRLDNRVENLRITTNQGNQHNRTAKGYTWCKSNKKWNAQIRLNGKSHHLGYYDTEEEARQSYLRAKPIYHTI